MKYYNKILSIIKGREMTLGQIANQNNLNYQFTKNYLEMLTELDLLQIRLIKNKKYYSEKLKLGKQCGLILGNNFNEDSIVFTPEQFIEWVLNKKKGDVCLWDEFIFGGNSIEELKNKK